MPRGVSVVPPRSRGPRATATVQRTRLLLLAVMVLAMVSCTSGPADDAPLTVEAPPIEEPVAAPTGQAVELVLPPRSTLAPAVADGLERRLRALAGALPEGIDALSVRSPDDAVFVPDLLELAAARGAGLVCAIGPEVADAADRTAVRHGETRLCAMPVGVPSPDEEGTVEPTPAVRIDVPVEDLGVLVGTAARTAVRAAVAADAARAADEDAEEEGSDLDAPPAPTPRVGLLLDGDELPGPRFRAGLLQGLGPVQVVEPTSPDTPPAEGLEEVLAAGAQVVVVDGGAGAAQIIAELDGRAGVVGPVDLWGDTLPAGVVLGYRLRWDIVVSVVLDRFAGADELREPVLLGDEDGVLELRGGPGQAATMAAVDAARAELTSRDDPPAPPPDEGPPDALR